MLIIQRRLHGPHKSRSVSRSTARVGTIQRCLAWPSYYACGVWFWTLFPNQNDTESDWHDHLIFCSDLALDSRSREFRPRPIVHVFHIRLFRFALNLFRNRFTDVLPDLQKHVSDFAKSVLMPSNLKSCGHV